MAPAARLRFGCFILDEHRGTLLGPDGAERQLRPKSFDLLRLLLHNPGRVVTRAEILDALWPGIFVTDDSITQCVVELRRALAGAGAELLRTIPRRGYILDARVEEERPAPPAIRAVPGAGIPVLAVLPFRRPDPDPHLASIADAILDGVVGTLAGLREPAVISANTTCRMTEAGQDPIQIAQRLRADYIASGALRRSGGGLRVTVELAEAAGGQLQWQRAFDISEAMLPEAQDDIAATIANSLAPRVREANLRHAGPAPAEFGAYFRVLRARLLMFRLERAAMEEAAALLAEAVAEAPRLVAAHLHQANWHSLLIGQGWAADAEAETAALEASLRAALDLDPLHGRALAMAGHYRAILRRDFDPAFGMFDRALDAAPGDAEVWLWSVPGLAMSGEAAEALRRAERAMRLSPEDPLIFRFEYFRAIAHYMSEDMEGAAHWSLRSLRGNPHFSSNLRLAAAALAALGRLEEAREIARRLLDRDPGLRIANTSRLFAMRDPAARERYMGFLLKAGLPP